MPSQISNYFFIICQTTPLKHSNLLSFQLTHLFMHHYIIQRVLILQQSNKKQMNRYPITKQNIDKDVWNRKVNATLMMSFQAEQETLPYLQQFAEILDRVNTLPLEQTLADNEVVMYFFQQCFPTICQKLINSKYFRNDMVLLLSNKILQQSVNLFLKSLDSISMFPKLSQILTIVFEPDVQYFKHNNQLEYKPYPWLYYGTTQDNSFLDGLKVGDVIDAMKYQSHTKKATWSRATITEINEDYISVRYLNDMRFSQKDIVKDSVEIAPLGTMSTDFDWRLDLKQGDTLDCCDNYGGWYSGTVVKAKKKENGKTVKVGFKLFDPLGDKLQKGQSYFGLSDAYDSDQIDVTSPQIQPLRAVARYKQYGFSKSHSDFINDFNDHVMQYLNGERIVVVPRNKFCSDTLFRISKNFIKQGGVEKMLQMLQDKVNPDLLTSLLVPLGQIAPILHKTYAKELVERLKTIIHKHLVDESYETIKSFTKDKSEAVFTAMKNLLKRVQSTQQSKQYQVSTKLELANLCLKSQSLKRRLQGLSEVKDILKSVRSHLPQKVNSIGKWLREHNVFQKIYVQNSHAQLIKKSSQFFKFLVVQNILEVNQLQLIYKAAQRGDYEARLSVYKLFEQVSHNFKKPHVDYLIDQILQSEIGLVATEDLDLLLELSKYSNYFPLQKVIAFLQKILFGENPNAQLLEATIKRYSQIVVKNTQMIRYREENIKMLTQKLVTDKVQVSCRILTTILQNVGSGDFGRYQILEHINKMKIDGVVLEAIKNNKSSQRFLIILQKLLSLISTAVQNSQRIKLNINTFIKFWEELVQNNKNFKQKQIYYKWCSAVTKVQNVFTQDNQNKLQEFFLKLTSLEEISSLNQASFDAISIMFISINIKAHKISVSNIWRSGKEEKVLKLLVPLKQLRFYDVLLTLIYNVRNPKVAQSSLQFYSNLYYLQDTGSSNRQQYSQKMSSDFFKFYKQGQYYKIPQVLKILDIIIDESEKGGPVPLKSLAMFKKGEQYKIDVLNESAYMSDTNKSFQIEIQSNQTLLQLRKQIAKKIFSTWQEVKIHQKEQILDIYNGRLIKDCPIKLNESVKVNKRHTLQSQQDLIINNKLSPKAIKAFEIVFRRFSTNGLMSKDECQKFTMVCLGDAAPKTYDERISNVYDKYDQDKDNYLTLQNFLNFYEDAARQRPNTVWGNLRSCRIRYDFKSMDDPDSDVLELETLPRYILSLNNEFYECLFDLLKQDENIAKPCWKMLEKMPVSAHLYQQLLNSIDYQILNIQNSYKTLYCLYIFQHLLENQQQNVKEKQWRQKFIKQNGYQKLFKFYTRLLQEKDHMNQVQIQISQFILNLISQFIVTVFKTENSVKSHEILTSNIDFDDLVSYISSQTLPTDKTKLSKFSSILNADEKYSKFKDHEWKGLTQKQMSNYIIASVKKLWKQKENSKIRDQMIENCLSILLTLMLHHKDTSCFLEIVPELIQKSPSHRLLVKIYLLLTCLCFYGKIDQQPIIAMLLNFLKYSSDRDKQMAHGNERSPKKQQSKASFISEQYFVILVVLIQWFGLSKISQQTIDILLQNVLTSQNQHIIQASALVLAKLKLDNIAMDTLEQIWKKCLFSNSISCKKPETRLAVYKLVLSFGSYNLQFTRKLTNLIISTLNPCINQLKLMSELQLKSRSIFNFAGLRNLGAICYILAMLQQFYMNPTFRYLMLRADDKKAPNLSIHNNRQYDDNLLHQIQKLFAFLDRTDRGDYNPIDFCNSYKGYDGNPINTCVQQDSQEFILMFLERLQTSLKQTPFKRILRNMYGGKEANLLTCSKCNHTKIKEQDFFSITLQVKNSNNLFESLNKFTNGEVINEYNCEFCSQKADVSKRIMISELPRIFIIRLQRIGFSLETFINEKISTKLEFPFQIDMTPYMYNPPDQKKEDINDKAQQTPKQEKDKQTKDQKENASNKNSDKQSEQTDNKIQQNNEQEGQKSKKEPNNSYDLVGVVAHNGGAEYGHYYSYVKTDNSQWLEINDSNVRIFDLKNAQQQWFGGTTQAVDQQFDWTVKKQNSRSAYLLMYQRREQMPIQLVYKDAKEKVKLIEELNLKEQTSQIVPSEEDDAKLLEEQQLPVSIRKFSKQQIVKDEEKKQIPEQSFKIQQPILPYIPQPLSLKINEDNLLHQFQTNICSSSFIKFYTKFLQLDLPKEQLKDTIELTLKLVLGIWLKQPALKQLLPALQKAIKKEPEAGEIIIHNQVVTNMLLESSDSDIRSCMESLLVTAVGGLISSNNLTLKKQNEIDTKVVNFLDHLFSLIPTTVSKNWMKFNQYFGFWKGLSIQGPVQAQFMINRQMISHFLDYFLDKKSPLGIYSKKKHEIGNKSSSINPNFTSLLDTVSNLVSNAMMSTPMRLTENDNKILMSFDFLDKMFSENNNFGSNLVKSMCFGNLLASQKVAIVLIKGYSKCTYETIQPFLDVTESFILIKDELQQYRIKWVIGCPKLIISPYDKSITCMNSHSMDQRLYNYDSTIQFDHTQSMLEGLFKNMTRMLNFCMLTLKCLLSMCSQDQGIKNYIWNLPPPIITYGHYHDFFQQFIDSYIKQGMKMTYSAYPKAQIGKSVLEIYKKIVNEEENKGEEKSEEKIIEKQQKDDSCNSIKGLDNNSENKEDRISDWIQNNFVSQGSDMAQHPYLIYQGSKNQYAITDSDYENQIQNSSSKNDGIEEQRKQYIYINDKIDPTTTQTPSNIRQTTEDNAQQIRDDKINSDEQENKDQTTEAPEVINLQQKQDQTAEIIEEPNSIYHPVQFKYQEQRVQMVQDLTVHHHNSQLVFIKTTPTLNRNDTFLNLNRKLIDRVPQSAWETSITKPYRGVLVRAPQKQGCRFKWKYGTGFVKAGEVAFVDTDQILRVWPYEKQYDWPKWNLN